MEIKSVVNNGVQIPNECTCIWCGLKCGVVVLIGWTQELIVLLYGVIIAEL